MKYLKGILIVFSAFFIPFVSSYFITNAINDDLYGRLIEKKNYPDEKFNDSLPTITLVLTTQVD